MGAVNSHNDSYVSSMLATFTGPDSLQPDDKFWDKFFAINFQQYTKKSSFASCTLDEHELKLRRNYGTSQNLRTFINLLTLKMNENEVKAQTVTEVANGLFILRSFLYRQLAAQNENVARLLFDPSSSGHLSPWHQHLKANGYDTLLQSIVDVLLKWKVTSNELYKIQAESASFLLSNFLIPTWQGDLRSDVFAYSYLLQLEPKTASKLVDVFITNFIHENLSYPSVGISVEDIDDITWVDFIYNYVGADKLGETSLWFLLLLAHRPDDGEIDIFNAAISTFVDESTCILNQSERPLLNGELNAANEANELYYNDHPSEISLDTALLIELEEGIAYQRNKDNQLRLGRNLSKSQLLTNGGLDNTMAARRRSGSLPSRLDSESGLPSNNPDSTSQTFVTCEMELLNSFGAPLIKINFNDLYTASCCSIDKDGTLMLVYTLLLRNKNVKEYFQARKDIDLLLCAVAKRLYVVENLVNSYSTYLSLCIILILSENGEFCVQLHETPVLDIAWFRERSVSDVTLGSLLVIVLCRLLNLNVSKSRDDFICENVLAIMSNMASTIKNLHPYACQQLVATFEVLGRRFLRLHSRSDQNEDNPEEALLNSDEIGYLRVLKAIMLALLQIMDACVVVHLPENPNFVYILLHKATVFRRFLEMEDFQYSLSNLEIVLQFYNDQLSRRKEPLSEEDIFEVIETCVEPFPYHLLRPVDYLKYQYIEDKNCPGFFLPFVSHIISHRTNLPFNPDMLPP